MSNLPCLQDVSQLGVHNATRLAIPLLCTYGASTLFCLQDVSQLGGRNAAYDALTVLDTICRCAALWCVCACVSYLPK